MVPADRYHNPFLDAQQDELREQLNFSEAALFIPFEAAVIYTLDVLYNDGRATVGIDLMRWPDTHLATVSYQTITEGAYVPGYFSFYEGPVLVEAIKHISAEYPKPDLIIVDGHGLAHPRQFGLACYTGLMLDVPCMGVAKSTLLHYNGEPGPEKGSTQDIILDDNRVGVVYRSQTNIKPIFISAGNKISLDTSIAIVSRLASVYRLPDCCRRADQASRAGYL